MFQVNLGATNTDGSGADRTMPGSQPSGGGGGMPPIFGGRASPYAGSYTFASVYQAPSSLPAPVIFPSGGQMPQPLPPPTSQPPMPGNPSIPTDMPVAGTNVTIPVGADMMYPVAPYADPGANLKRWLLIGLGVGVLAGIVLFLARR